MVRKVVALLLGAVCSFLWLSPTQAAPAASPPLPIVDVNGGTLSSNTEWVGGTVYRVLGTVTVLPGVILKVDPGAIVKFQVATSLVVNGTLNATGTSGSLIYFTSYRDDQIGGDTGGTNPAPRDWNNIEFGQGSTTHIDNAIVRYSGYFGQSVFQALAFTVPAIGNNVTFASNAANGIQLPGGQPSTNVELPSNPAAPYLISGNITVPTGVTLTIDPGAVLKFEVATTLVVNGGLTATGTAGLPIYFTSYRDDQIDGNTLGSSPSVRDWNNIQFGPGSTTHIDFATLRYSGYFGQSVFQALGYTVPTIGNNVTLNNNVANGIQLPGGQMAANVQLPSYPAAPYLVSGNITVPTGVTLTIDPGAVLKFEVATTLVINGGLTATGTTALPIYFTSYRDDQIDGNTFGSSPSVRDWNNIQFGPGSTTTIDFAVVRYSGYFGGSVFQALGYTVPAIGNNVALNNNVANGIQLPGGQPSSNVELPSYPAAPYLISGNITVPTGVTLTVDPGAILKFEVATTLVVNGTLKATGTTASPIYFTSYRDDQIGGNTLGGSPSVRDWNNIQFGQGSTTTIDFAVLRYSGYFSGSVFQALGYTVPAIGNNVTYASNVANGIQLPGGQLAANVELPSYPAAPYLISGNITVPTGVTLTIDPGAILKFEVATGIIVNGALDAPGRAGSAIYFTSYRDDTIGKNTAGSSPQPGDWGAIFVSQNGTASLAFSVARYGGYGGTGALNLNVGTLTLTSGCVTNNNLGLVAKTAGASINNSWITGNSTFGVDNTGTAPLDATNNWWGAASGPSNSLTNPSGTGDAVSAGVTFLPYVQVPPRSCPPDGPRGPLPLITTLGAPQRVVDTRAVGGGGPIATGTSRCFVIAGQAGIPADAAAVVINVTAVGYGTNGWLTVYPNGQSVPATSTLNFDTHEYAMANGTIMRVGTGGQVCVSTGTVGSVAGNAQVILDATGFVTTDGLTELPMLTSPQRLVDTRSSGGPIPTGTSRCFSVAGAAGIPADASAVVLNVTAVGYGAQGWLTAYPSGQTVPATSTLNFDTNSEYAVANGAIMRLGTGGQVCVNVGTVSSVPGDSHVILDVTGYLTAAGLGQLPMLPAPQRLVDTRTSGGPIASGQSRCFAVAGLAGIPDNAIAAVLNVTAVGYGRQGWLTAYPNGQSVPATSTLNFDTTEYAMANGAVIRLGTAGQLCVSVGTVNSAAGTAHVIIDVVGYE